MNTTGIFSSFPHGSLARPRGPVVARRSLGDSATLAAPSGHVAKMAAASPAHAGQPSLCDDRARPAHRNCTVISTTTSWSRMPPVPPATAGPCAVPGRGWCLLGQGGPTTPLTTGKSGSKVGPRLPSCSLLSCIPACCRDRARAACGTGGRDHARRPPCPRPSARDVQVRDTLPASTCCAARADATTPALGVPARESGSRRARLTGLLVRQGARRWRLRAPGATRGAPGHARPR